MDIRFYRFAIITIPSRFKSLEQRWHHWRHEIRHPEIGSIVLQGHPFQPIEKRGAKQLVRAGCKLRHPPKITGTQLVIPRKEREILEREIINASNLLSLGINAGTTLSSPLGFEVAFLPEDNKAKHLMSKVSSTLDEQGTSIRFSVLGMAVTQPLIPNDLDQFRDRLDGLSLMAEALSNSHTTGRFHEFIRLFERAFKAGGAGLVAPMFAFLKTSSFDFTLNEVKHWIGLRNSATHADLRNNFSTAVEITPIIGRMEQAAYDVLCNKVNWRSDDSDRRYLFKPTGGVEPPESSASLFVGAGAKASYEFGMRLADRFDVFAMDSQVLDMKVFARSLTFLPMRKRGE